MIHKMKINKNVNPKCCPKQLEISLKKQKLFIIFNINKFNKFIFVGNFAATAKINRLPGKFVLKNLLATN